MRLIYLATIVVLLASCDVDSDPDTWSGTIYPDGRDLTNYRHIGEYISLAHCRLAAESALNRLDARYAGTYECGLNCERYSEYSDLLVCEETRQ